ncbi:CHASE4 domain-containing protein [Desulfogranum mediterraneum]|uniref:CHASE4 domain-containing protein n=1 Tax=Desulfogranum mediterraneum TaxID=160661 RepID=UPI0005569922|nr:CHASE4 domain-containing protein [Desulfogranum mediterraneum]
MQPIIASGVALLSLGLIVVVLLLWGINGYIIQPAFLRLEEKQALEDAGRVRSALDGEIANLGTVAIDWANWDDTYAFAQDQNPDYVQSNYPVPATLSRDSKVDLLAIFDRSGRRLLLGNYHPGVKKQLGLDIFSGSVPPVFALLEPLLKEKKAVAGLLSTNHGLIILSAHHILDSKGRGPSRGVLIMGRFFTPASLAALAKRVQVECDFFMADGGRLSPAEQVLFSRLSSSSTRLRQAFRQGFQYQIYPDIANQPLLLLRSKARGEILTIGKSVARLLNISLFLVSSVLLVCLLIYRVRMKISKESLRDSEERYRTLFANKHTVMLLIDPDTGSIVDANPAACRYYGWSLEALKTMCISDINTLAGDKLSAALELAGSGNCKRFVFKHRKADGSIADVEVYSDPMVINGEVLLYSIIHDITERKEAEKNRIRLERQLRQALKVESLGRMAAAVAHHYNNLLCVVMGNLELTRDILPPSLASATTLAEAMAAAKRASEIGQLMLAYLGQTDAEREPLKLGDVCGQCLSDLRGELPEQVTLDLALSAPDPVVQANSSQICLLVENLVTNACEALGDRSGVISVAVGTLSSDEVSGSHYFPAEFKLPSQSTDYACLEVSDTGRGIEENDIDKIFDPFFSTKFTGRGLGLPLVLGAMKSYGGLVSVESVPDQGSRFRVLLPILALGVQG